MSTALVQIAGRDTVWHPLTDTIVIGKDILELLSSSMYVDPMSIYREYVQNAADAIDDAKAEGLLDGPGFVDVTIDTTARTVTITDNGTGIPHDEFVVRLTAFGASVKRGRGARGFRGVGRLAGIGYCQELVFRTRTHGDSRVSELRWDCKKLKGLLRSNDHTIDLSDTVAQVVAVRRTDARGLPARFFEVELRGIVRHRNDQLLSATCISDYLSQVAPVPFRKEFPYRDRVLEHLHEHVRLGDVHVHVGGVKEPLYRPHRGGLELAPDVLSPFTDLELLSIPSVDGGLAGLGWIVHHGYTGALPPRCKVRGLRVRCGDIQVGDDRIFEELFPEARFNAWAVGEVHVMDPRIVPNGRRDHFEQNVHYNNLLTHLVPAAREIARRCRTSSVQRKWVRDFELQEGAVRERAGILKQGAVGRADRQRLVEEIREALKTLEQIVNRGLLPLEVAMDLKKRLDKLEREVARVLQSPAAPRALASLPGPQRRAYQHIIGLIYECSTNKTAAKLLVDKILTRLS